MILPKKSDRPFIVFGLKIVGDFGVSIAAPIVIFVLIGKWLDSRYQTKPIFIIIAFVFASISSAIIIYKKTKEYSKEYQKITQNYNKIN